MPKLVIMSLLLILNFAYADEFKNDLQYETSPYLKKHETNPVNWMPWGKKAFDKAKNENKPIYLSIGYSTCHWCHVMEEESFTNKEIANLLNKYFISIKVDIEELPQVDSYYQELYYKINKKRAGWPLNIFLTSNKSAFFIDAYLPPKRDEYSEGLDTLLLRFGKNYNNDYKSILSKAQKIKDSSVVIKTVPEEISSITLSASIYDDYDEIYNGFSHGRKLPQAAKLELMMNLASINNDKTLLKNSYNMLDMMALRGLYDHVDGGFYRYADAVWEIAHFEKMLYNQAELIPLYSGAYNRTQKKLYKDVVVETIAMVDKRFLNNNFYFSASDTDSKGIEGDYFVFSVEEIRDALENNPNAEALEDSLEFVVDGNFRGRAHLNFYTSARPKGFELFRKDLLKIRANKKYPFIDKKINTAWNAMMIEALYDSSLIDSKYKVKADEHLKALKELMFFKGELHHQTLVGLTPKQKGLLEDYSFFIGALIAGYEVDYDEEKLHFAEYLLSRAKDKFYKNGVWYLSDDGLNIKANLNDKYYTAPLSKMLQNIIKLASLKGSFKYDSLAVATLKSINNELGLLQANAPAASIAFLMQSLSVVTIKSNEGNLREKALEIKNIDYPYVLTKMTKDDEYLACTMRRCFSRENVFEDIIKDINMDINKTY